MRHTLSIFLAASLLLTGCAALPPPPEPSDQSSKEVQLARTESSASHITELTRIHVEPTVDSLVLDTLPAGARVKTTTMPDAPGWAQVDSGAGPGWIQTHSLAAGANSVSVKLPTIYKVSLKTSLHASATTKSKKLRTIAKGALLEKTGVTAKGSWVRTKSGNHTGWVLSKALSMQPHVKYQTKSPQKLTSKAGSGKTLVSIAKGQQVTHTGRTSGKHFQVGYGKKLGWVNSTTLTRVYAAKFTVKGYATAHSTAGGTVAASLYKGQVIGTYKSATKKVKGVAWTQVRVGTHDRWVVASKLTKTNVRAAIFTPTKVIAKYKAKKSTKLHVSPNGKVASTVGSGYVTATTSKDVVKSAGKSWIHVTQGGKHLWIDSSHWNTTTLNATLGAPKASKPAPKPAKNQALASMTKTNWTDAEYLAAIKQNIAPWCPSVPVKLSKREGEYYATSHPLEIHISRIGNPNPNWGNLLSVSLHECAHIKQFSTYKNNLWDLDRDMDPLWGKSGMGIEYLADCMSDLMGGKRKGTLPNGWTYWSGYGNTCNTKQNQAAQSILNGKTLS